MSATSSPDLSLTLAGIPMVSPLMLLSGCVGFGEELTRLEGFDFHAVGAIGLKGTTLNPKAGNRTPRLAETPGGMLNAIGLQNPGARKVVSEILPRLAALKLPCRLIANIAGSTVEEYGEVARIFDDSPVDAIEINISCPNVKEGGAAFGSDPVVAARVVELVRKSTRKPVIPKLSPNVTDITTVARATLEAGADAFSAINTLMGMTIDVERRRPILGNVQGGLSGPAIKPVALLKVWQVYQVAKPHGIPIIGQGGVDNANDVVAFMLAGSRMVGVGTALFRDPHAPAAMTAGVRDYLQRHGMKQVTELTGALEISPK